MFKCVSLAPAQGMGEVGQAVCRDEEGARSMEPIHHSDAAAAAEAVAAATPAAEVTALVAHEHEQHERDHMEQDPQPQ